MRLCAVACMLAGVLAASAADEVLVHFPPPPGPKPKDKVTVTAKGKTTTTLKVTGKETLTTVTEIETHFVFTDTIEEVSEKRPTKLERHYEKATITTTSKTPAGEAKKDQALEGKTVAIQKKGRAYEFKIDFLPVSEGAAKDMLDEEFNVSNWYLRTELFPKGQVKNTWNLVSGAWVQSLAGPEFTVNVNLFKGSGKVKVVENRTPKDKDGKPMGKERIYAEIDVDLEVPITNMNWGEKSADSEKLSMKAEKGSKLTLSVESKGLTDGTLPQETIVTVTYAVRGKLDECEVELTVTTNETRKLEKK
jgi:hypothetical protein